MVTALDAARVDPSIGHCACLRRELSGEPDVGNLHLRFDEGRAGRAIGVALSPTLPARQKVYCSIERALLRENYFASAALSCR